MSISPDRRAFMAMTGKAGGLALLNTWVPLQSRDSSRNMEALLEAHLVKEHPRLHLTRAQWVALREAIQQDDSLSRWYAQLQQTADKMLHQPPAEYKLVGPRLLNESRAALARISTLAGLYRLDGDTRKADRARAELKAICAFPSWHPPHFLDVAEMTNAAALGYDWLYDVLTEGERQTIRSRIIEFGLKPGLTEYAQDVMWSLPFANNWGQVCAGGLTMGALAIVNDGANDPGGIAPEPAAILGWTTSKVRNAMLNYAPDGGWPEGPGYWSYATNYTCAMISALMSALGMDFDLSEITGFAETGDFRVASAGPSGQSFNYADADANMQSAPEMFWLAKRFSKPLYATSESSIVARTSPGIFHLVWSQPHMSQLHAPQLPLDLRFSRIDLAYFRTSWTDPNAIFVGFKGGNNAVSHGHLDLGTFVLDAFGERWALDLGPDDYDLPGYFGAERWQYYRLRSEGHNVLTLGSGNQVLSAKAPLHDFRSTPTAGFAEVDLTEAYRPAFKRVGRQMTLERSPQQRVMMTDTVDGDNKQTIRWNMHTRAQIQLDGRRAVLELNGKRLRATIELPSDAVFEIVSSNVPPPQAQQPEVRNLTINFHPSNLSTQLKVVFEPV